MRKPDEETLHENLMFGVLGLRHAVARFQFAFRLTSVYCVDNTDF